MYAQLGSEEMKGNGRYQGLIRDPLRSHIFVIFSTVTLASKMVDLLFISILFITLKIYYNGK